MMKYTTFILLFALGIPGIAQDDAKSIFIKATNQVQVYNINMSLDLKTTDKSGRVKEKGFDVLIAKFGSLEKTRMLMQRPERAAGVTIIITNEPEEIGTIEVYTPANGKIRKMKATAENMAMVGSNVSFSNFASREIDDAKYTLLGEEEFEGKSCYKVSATENSEEQKGKAEFLIDKMTYNILQVIVYDEKGEQTNITKLSDFQPIDGMKGKSQPRLIYSHNLQDNKVTEVKVLKITPMFDISEDDFNIEKLSM